MSSRVSQVLFTTIAGASFGAVIVVLARRGRLTMRYTLGWLFVAGCIIAGGLFSGLVAPVADVLGVSEAALIIAVATLGLLGLTVQLSITVSGLIEYVRTLAEAHALLEEQVASTQRADVRAEGAADAPEPPDEEPNGERRPPQR